MARQKTSELSSPAALQAHGSGSFSGTSPPSVISKPSISTNADTTNSPAPPTSDNSTAWKQATPWVTFLLAILAVNNTRFVRATFTGIVRTALFSVASTLSLRALPPHVSDFTIWLLYGLMLVFPTTTVLEDLAPAALRPAVKVLRPWLRNAELSRSDPVFAGLLSMILIPHEPVQGGWYEKLLRSRVSLIILSAALGGYCWLLAVPKALN